MGYYGRSMYRGDFYRGARGDFWDDVGGVLGDIGGTIGNVLKYVPGVSKVITSSTESFNRTMAPAHPAISSPQVGGGGLSLSPQVVIPGVGGGRVRLGKGKPGSRPIDILSSGGGGRRRMNPLNVKALRRSLRRADSFLHIAKKFVKVIKPGHHVELKAIHHKHKK